MSSLPEARSLEFALLFSELALQLFKAFTADELAAVIDHVCVGCVVAKHTSTLVFCKDDLIAVNEYLKRITVLKIHLFS